LGDVYSLALSMRATVEDGKILRLEEYFDAAALVPLRMAIEAKRQAG
jgi:ketosteroid isomerase-like protein